MRRLVAVAVVLAVVASLMTYATFSTVLRNGVTPATNGVDDLPATTVKLRVPQPTLIIKVNGEERVRMKDPFTKYGFAMFSLNMFGQDASLFSRYISLCHFKVYPYKVSAVHADLYSTQFTDIVNAVNPGTPNITLTTSSTDIVDNGTALIENITVTGISPINVNITAIALKTLYIYFDPSVTTSIPYIVIATNLASPLTLSVNDSIVVQWIITIYYGVNVGFKPILYHILKVIGVPGADVWNTYKAYINTGECAGDAPVLGTPKAYIGNGNDKVLASMQNYLTNITRLNNYYAFVLCYFDTSVSNPTTFAFYSYEGAEEFNITVNGLGADRAVLLKIVLSFG